MLIFSSKGTLSHFVWASVATLIALATKSFWAYKKLNKTGYWYFNINKNTNWWCIVKFCYFFAVIVWLKQIVMSLEYVH